jgi:anti-anti-sigma factor
MRLIGELDISTVEAAARSMSVMAGSATNASIDLSELTFIDSSGVRLLLNVLRDQRAKGGDLVLHAPTETVRHVFDILGLEANGVMITPPTSREA